MLCAAPATFMAIQPVTLLQNILSNEAAKCSMQKKEMRPVGKQQAEEQCRVQHMQALVAHASRAEVHHRCTKLTCWSRVSLS